MDGIDLLASAMEAAKVRLDVAASNLANVASPGFARRVASVTLTPAGLHAGVAFDSAEGPLRRTGRALDLAVAGPGAMWVAGAHGTRESIRSASFAPSADGTLVDARGRALLGEHGPIRAGAEANVDARGVVREGDRTIDRIAVTRGAAVQSGFLAATNVDSIREMVDVMSAQRSFETAAQTLTALDGTRAKSVNDVAMVRG